MTFRGDYGLQLTCWFACNRNAAKLTFNTDRQQQDSVWAVPLTHRFNFKTPQSARGRYIMAARHRADAVHLSTGRQVLTMLTLTFFGTACLSRPDRLRERQQGTGRPDQQMTIEPANVVPICVGVSLCPFEDDLILLLIVGTHLRAMSRCTDRASIIRHRRGPVVVDPELPPVLLIKMQSGRVAMALIKQTRRPGLRSAPGINAPASRRLVVVNPAQPDTRGMQIGSITADHHQLAPLGGNDETSPCAYKSSTLD